MTKGAVPLKAYQDIPAFKLYLVDVGLLAAMTDLDAKTLLKGLKHFVAGNELPFGVRTSMSDYRRQEKLINLPLYALSQLWEVCDAFN